MVKVKRLGGKPRSSSSAFPPPPAKIRPAVPLRVDVRLRASLSRQDSNDDFVGGVALGEEEGYVELMEINNNPGLELRFSTVHRAQTSQAELYRSFGRGFADAVFSGAGGCMVALGTAGAGKTYALMGELGEFGRMGMVPRLASELLDRIAAKVATSEKLAKTPIFLTVSQYDLSEDGFVKDLLIAPSKGPQKKDGGVRGGDSPVQERVERLSDVLLVLEKGSKERRKREKSLEGTTAHTVTVLTLWRERSPSKGGHVVWPGAGGAVQAPIEIAAVAAVEVSGELRRGGEEARELAEVLSSASSLRARAVGQENAPPRQGRNASAPRAASLLVEMVRKWCGPGARVKTLVTVAREEEAAPQNGAWLALGASCLVGPAPGGGRAGAGNAAGDTFTTSAPPPVLEVQVGRPMPWESVSAAQHAPRDRLGSRLQLAASGAPLRSAPAANLPVAKSVRWGSEEQGVPREGRAVSAEGGARQARASQREGEVRQLFLSPSKSPARSHGTLGRDVRDGGVSAQQSVVGMVKGALSERETDLAEQVRGLEEVREALAATCDTLTLRLSNAERDLAAGISGRALEQAHAASSLEEMAREADEACGEVGAAREEAHAVREQLAMASERARVAGAVRARAERCFAAEEEALRLQAALHESERHRVQLEAALAGGQGAWGGGASREREDGWRVGRDEGYQEGWRAGRDVGVRDGWEEGRRHGWHEAQEELPELREEAKGAREEARELRAELASVRGAARKERQDAQAREQAMQLHAMQATDRLQKVQVVRAEVQLLMHHASAAASEAALVADPKAWALPCIPAPPPPLPPPVVARGGCVCGGERARRLLEQEMAACERILQDELSVRDAHVRQLTAENRSIASALASALLSPAPPPPPARAQPPTALARAAAPGGVGHVAWAVEQQVGVGHAGSREGGGGSAACQSGAAVSSGGEKRDAHDAVEEAYAAPGLRPSLRHPRAGAAGANVASVGAWGWGGGQAAVAVGQEATPARPRIGAQPHAVGRGE